MTTLDVAVVAHNVVRHDGQGRAILELIRALAERDHRVTVVAHRLDDELRDAVAFARIPRSPGPQLVDDAWLFATGTARVRRRRHDVSVVLGPCALPRGPFVYYAQFSQRGWAATWDRQTRPSWYHRTHAGLAATAERAVARRAAAIVACGAGVAADLGQPSARATVVPNGVDLEELAPAVGTDRRAARAELGLPASATVVAFIGEFRTACKGLDPLLGAIAAGDEVLVVAGDGDAGRARSRAAELGLGDRLHLVGVRPAKLVLACADVVAVPSRYEPFSLVAVEAAAAGLPVVVTRRAGAAAHLPAAAVLVDEPSVDELRLALDEARRRAADPTIAARCRADAEALAWPTCAAKVADVVEATAR